MITTTWTIAYRKPRANHFRRVTNWSGTWAQAREVAATFQEASPDLQVYYVPAADSAGQCEADRGNILMDSGKRIKIRETGELSPWGLLLVPDADAAQARWSASAS